MKCAVSLFAILVILTFTLPTEIECSCSQNLGDIISLMSQDPDYQRNPCFIEWNADQDKKLSELWRKRAELEDYIARNYEIELKNRQIERENRENWENSFRKITVEKNGVSAGGLYALIIVILFIVCCCCFLCFSSMQSDDNLTDTETTNTFRTSRNPGEFTVISTPQGLASNEFGDLRRFHITSATSANANLTASFSVDAGSTPSDIRIFVDLPPEQETSAQPTNVPLLPRGTINRINSLPSYEEAVKMPSAPPRD